MVEKKEPETIPVDAGTSGSRLDRFLAERYPDVSRSRLQKLIDLRFVRVDDHPVSASHRLKPGQTIQLTWPEKKETPLKNRADAPAVPVLFEDEDILVVNKPAGLVVHPSAGHFDGHTLVEILLPKLAEGAWFDDVRPGLVHRLDRDTSGVLVVAKTPAAQARISNQFARRQVKKTYRALVHGRVPAAEGSLESRLGRHPGKRQRYAVTGGGRWALTKFKTIELFEERATYLELKPLTGRTHQLRVQLAEYGHPIVGDHVYGPPDKKWDFVKRHLLHAFQLEFRHPETGQPLSFSAPLPPDFQEALKLIRLNA